MLCEVYNVHIYNIYNKNTESNAKRCKKKGVKIVTKKIWLVQKKSGKEEQKNKIPKANSEMLYPSQTTSTSHYKQVLSRT